MRELLGEKSALLDRVAALQERLGRCGALAGPPARWAASGGRFLKGRDTGAGGLCEACLPACLHPPDLPACRAHPRTPPTPHRESLPADLATIAELQAQVAGLQQQLASYRAQLALLAPGGAPRAPSPGGAKGGRPHLPPLSSLGQGLPQFPPPGAAMVGALGSGRTKAA